MPSSRSSFVSLALSWLLTAGIAAGIVPEPLPDPQITGFAFPESEATLTRWITEMTRGEPASTAAAFARVHQHAWGLWTALTAETRQTAADAQKLRVFETWLTLEEVAEVDARGPATLMGVTRSRAPLRPLRHLRVAAEVDGGNGAASAASTASTRALGFTKFDPSATEHIVRQQLLRRDALDALLEGGAQQVPPFPATALALKSVFQIARVRQLVGGRYHPLKIWQGPPATPRVWGPNQWLATVWIDVLGAGAGQGAVDEIPLADGSTRTDATTYPISNLIHYRLSATEADALNAENPANDASAGDFALLVAMHVAGRETARWTWQTFWWTPAADAPPAPSSSAIAALRPAELRGPARHYAMSLAYSMLSPDQPYTGGENRTPAVYAYNPWLEARLAPADLPGSIAGFAPGGEAAANNFGVQSNCMSCHAQANYNPRQRSTAPQPSGARYVDLGAAEFVGTLQVDFLWSIARHAR